MASQNNHNLFSPQNIYQSAPTHRKLTLKSDGIKKNVSKKTRKNKRRDVPKVQEVVGSGRIVSSGTTIQGFETRFKEELAIGDQLFLQHPRSLETEHVTVVSILSQRSAVIQTGFSSDLVSTSAYHIAKSSVLTSNVDSCCNNTSTAEPASSATDSLTSALHKQLQQSQSSYTFREKKGMWGYQTVRKVHSNPLTAEEKLDLRVKQQGRDKHCW